MRDIGIIGSADGPTAIFVSKSENEEAFWKSGGIVDENNDVVDNSEIEFGLENETLSNNEEIVLDNSINEELNSRTLSENLDAGIKIMGIGMVAVFGVLTILYIVVKIMGYFAKSKKDSNDEKN